MTKEQMYLLGFNTACDRIQEELEYFQDCDLYVYAPHFEEKIAEVRSRVNGKVETVPKMR